MQIPKGRRVDFMLNLHVIRMAARTGEWVEFARYPHLSDLLATNKRLRDLLDLN
jgi:hypothetical protein